MAVLELDHVQLAMPAGREAEAIAFYEGLLGIPHVPKPEHLARRGGCWFERGALKVHLGVEPEFRPATKAHPALIVDDVRGLVAVLTAAGCTVSDDEPLAGYDRVYVNDPFGNRIELMQPLAQQPADEPVVDLVTVSITGPDAETLATVTRGLVDARLVACGNILPTVRSIYRWQGAVQDEAEACVLLHTRADHLSAIIRHVNAIHPYDTVQILAATITHADPTYREWLVTETTPTART